jgi:hypothetical protein
MPAECPNREEMIHTFAHQQEMAERWKNIRKALATIRRFRKSSAAAVGYGV